MKMLRNLVAKYIFSDSLDFKQRVQNMVCMIGLPALVVGEAAYIFQGASLLTFLSALFMLVALILFQYFCIRFADKVNLINNLTLLMLVLLTDITYPVIYFSNGGIRGGTMGYFILSTVLIFLLSRGIVCTILVIVHALIILAVYYLEYSRLLRPVPLSTAQQFSDSITVFFISGTFIGLVIKALSFMYYRERKKAGAAIERAGAAIERLERSQQTTRELFESNPHITFLFDLQGGVIDCNLAAMNLCGLTSKDETKAGFAKFIASSIPEFQRNGLPSVPFSGRLATAIKDGHVKMTSDLFVDGEFKTLNVEMTRIPYMDTFAIAAHIIDLTTEEEFKRGIIHRDKLLSAVNAVAAVLMTEDGADGTPSEVSISDKVARALELLCLGVEVDRAFIWRNREAGGVLLSRQICAWRREGEPPALVELPFDTLFPGLARRGISSKIGVINAMTKNLDAETINADVTEGMKSLLMTPIIDGGLFVGFITFEDFTKERKFSHEDEDIISYGATLVGAAFKRAEMVQNIIQAREQALASTRAKSDFLSNMSHEMRTPMNAIIGMTAIAKASKEIDKKNYCLNKIEDASTHLLGVINDILDMSKIEANKFELSYVEFNFEKMLQKVANVINFRVEEKLQSFQVRIDRDIPRFLLGDDQRISQVITNLLSNAVKFTPENGVINLDARLLDKAGGLCVLQISVTDTGIGINPEQQGRLFKSFEQADSGTSRNFGGTGLGLAISKRIVEMMGGRIWLESELGKGSTFAFTMRAQRAEGNKESVLEPGVSWKNLRVMVIDDSPEILDYFLDIAARFEITCDTAPGGEEALALLKERGPYDIYFVDWKMPGMNGIELSRRIKRASSGRSVVIMISAMEWAAIEDEAREAGVDKFLSKPLFPSDIADLINECLGLDSALDDKDGGADETYAGNFKGKRLLLAEDVEINREIVISLMESTQLEIDCAENGEEAVAAFERNPDRYDMIFMDVQMPKMDGYEATRRIRALGASSARAAEIPIVAMTANVFKEDIEKCLVSGMNDHIGKPLDFKEMVAKLKKYLQPPPARS
ncbi:MAG: response regulator [Clostridiales bacterium]|jgi:signal transduction histidine kinase/DNA-binding response OmpR family regulator/PAS domain-containing protein|nr:response regulator [Clostridiales bacterium]